MRFSPRLDLEALGGQQPRDGREKTRAGLYDEAPQFQDRLLPVRFCPQDWTTIWGAAALGYPRILLTLVGRGVPLEARDPGGRTALHYAAEFRQTETLCCLLEQGADANSQDKQGQTPLFLVREPNALPFLTALVNAGADPNLPDGTGVTPLLYALCERQQSLANALQTVGATPGFAEAAFVGDYETAIRRTDCFPVNALLPDGDTLLCRASRQGWFALVALLLERGAEPNRPNRNGETPLSAAALASRGRILRLLLDNGAAVDHHATESERMTRWAGIS